MMKPYPPRNQSRDFTRVNMRIRVPEIRCIDADGNQLGIIQTRDALRMAQAKNLDLVEISPTAKPPVCRIMDYGKYKYEQGKKEKAQKKHQVGSKMKEIKFHPNVGDHDYETKLRHIKDFLEEGARIKVSLWFRGREGAHQEIGFALFERVIKDLEPISLLEQKPQLFGKSLIMRLMPKPGLKVKKPSKPAGEQEHEEHQE